MKEAFDTCQVNVGLFSFYQVLICEKQMFLNYFGSFKAGGPKRHLALFEFVCVIKERLECWKRLGYLNYKHLPV